MVGFVDDSTGSFNDFQPQTQLQLAQMFPKMEHDAQLWNNLLYCSGGKLELSKCSFHVLHFEFLPNGTPVPSIEQYVDKIHIRDAETNTQVPISAKRSFERHKTLGHHKSPYSSAFPEIQHLQDKADRLALAITMCPISRYGAYLAYHTVFLPSVKYTLPQSFFPRSVLEKAQSTSISRVISKCGYNRNTARALIYAPTEYAGGGFIPWHLLQGEGQIQHFLKHWRTDTIVSTTLRIAVSWAQWQSGHHKSIFTDVHTPLPYLECRWLRSLRDFLACIDASIKLDTAFIASPERTNDLHIMTLASKCAIFSNHDLAIINYCRLYLHVTTISELFDPDGKTIITRLFDCQREPWFNPDTYVTLQRRPSQYQIRSKWQRFCRQFTTATGHLSESISLGQWTTTGDKLRRQRETYTTHTRPRKVYHWRYGSYWLYNHSKEDQLVMTPVTPSSWKPGNEPCTAIHISQQTNGNIVLKTPLPPRIALKSTFRATTFHQYVTTTSIWEQQLLQGIDFKYSPFELVHQLSTIGQEISLYLVSDGSQRGNDMTYGWVFGNENGIIYAEQAGPGYGDATSHRAEAWGMLSGILFIHHLGIYTDSRHTSPPLTLYLVSDNSGLIHRMKQRTSYHHSYPNSTLQADWDLVEQIHTLEKQIDRFKISYLWVRGHQDEVSDNLSVEAMYNVRADELAGDAPVSRAGPFTTEWLLPAERCRLIIANRNIQSNFTYEIRHAYSTPPLFEYLTQRHQWNPAIVYHIDWSAFSQATRHTTRTTTQLMKLVHEKLPTSYEISKSNPHVDPKCRHCDCKETFTHLLRCKNPYSQQFREIVCWQLDQYFTDNEIPEQFHLTFLFPILAPTRRQPNYNATISLPYGPSSHWVAPCPQRILKYSMAPPPRIPISPLRHTITTVNTSIYFWDHSYSLESSNEIMG